MTEFVPIKTKFFDIFFEFEKEIKMQSANGFDIYFEFADSEIKVQEILIEISEENFYFKERNRTSK